MELNPLLQPTPRGQCTSFLLLLLLLLNPFISMPQHARSVILNGTFPVTGA